MSDTTVTSHTSQEYTKRGRKDRAHRSSSTRKKSGKVSATGSSSSYSTSSRGSSHTTDVGYTYSQWECTCTCGCDAFTDTLWSYINYVVSKADVYIIEERGGNGGRGMRGGGSRGK